MLVNTDEQEITVFGNLGKDEPLELYKISIGNDSPSKTYHRLTDMKFVKKNRLITLSIEGKLSVFMVTKLEHHLLKEFDLRTLRQFNSGSSFVSLGVDNSGGSDFICVSTQKNLEKG